MYFQQEAPTGPVTNMAEAQAYLAYHSPEASAARNKARVEAYAKSPEGMAKAKAKQDKQNTITKIYNEQGDEALADWYLSQDPSTMTRAETNPAKNVKKSGGKFTFAQAAQEEVDRYNASQASVANPAQLAGPLQNTFQFALDKPYQSGNNTPSKPTPAATPSGSTEAQVSTKPVEETTGKFPWQKAKEKAQAFQKTSDNVNSWKEGGDPYKMTFNNSDYKFDSSFKPWGQDK